MNNLKIPLVAILCICLSIKSFCQTEFAKGYIVLNNNDTLNGFIKQDVEGNLLNKIIYSNNENGTPNKEYAAGEIQSFYFNEGNLFESVHFKDVNDSPAVCFAKYVLKGYYSVYSFRQKDIQYFLIKHEDSTYLLYDDIILSSGSYDTKGNYQNQLSFLSRNCGKLNSTILQTRFSEQDITAFTKKINDCVAPGSTNSNMAVKPKSKTSFYLYAGGLPLGDKYEYTGRALVRISTPSISKNVSLNVGANYLAHQVTEENAGITRHPTTNIFSASITLQNNFTTGVIQPYVEAGIGAAYKQEKDHFKEGGTDPANKFGVDFILAAGIEGYITKHFAVKADWRYELLTHYPTIGVAYFF